MPAAPRVAGSWGLLGGRPPPPELPAGSALLGGTQAERRQAAPGQCEQVWVCPCDEGRHTHLTPQAGLTLRPQTI